MNLTVPSTMFYGRTTLRLVYVVHTGIHNDSVFIYMPTYVHTDAYTCIHMHTLYYSHIYKYTYAYICTHISINTYAYIYIYIYIYKYMCYIHKLCAYGCVDRETQLLLYKAMHLEC